MILTFEKENNNNWYVVLPEWKGSHDDLQMVLGADTLLDFIKDDDNRFVKLDVSLEAIDGYNHLKLKEEPDFGGGIYLLNTLNGKDFDHELWLCDVILFIYGYVPENIYFKKV
jgi:hypothetical protein